MSICIVTDSCADLPEEFVSRYNISVAPFLSIFEDKTYRDGVDITPQQFYEKLARSNYIPTTGMVTPGYFSEMFAGLLRKYDTVIALIFDSKLSGAYNSAVTAAKNFPEDAVVVVDTKGATLGQGLTVIKAACMADRGATKEEILKEANRMVDDIRYAIVLGSLDYLHKGGRLSSSQRIVGNVLNIKPIMGLDDGTPYIMERARGMKRAYRFVVDYIKSFDTSLEGKTIGLSYTNAVKEGNELERIIKENFHPAEIVKSQAGAAIGTHVGPQTIGVYFER